MSEKEKVMSWIDEHEQAIIEALQDIIKIPSVNPWFTDDQTITKEGEVQNYIASRLSKIGASINKWEPDPAKLAKFKDKPGYYADHKFENRPNLAATFKGTSDSGKSILLTGHIDVVKPGEGWTTPPFGGIRENNRIYGRGTVDMKGGVTAMIMAVEAIKRSGFNTKGDIIVGTVVDEEAGGMGTLDFIQQGYRADGCILTEPTGMNVAPLCRGILWGKIIIPGRSGHIEMPMGNWKTNGAVDAIDKAMIILENLKVLNKEWAVQKTHPLLPLPCQINVAQINAGEYPTSYANSAEIVFDAQYLPSEKDKNWLGGNVKQEIQEFIHQVAQLDPWLKENPPKIEWLIDADCGETSAEDPFVKCCENSLKQLAIDSKIEGTTCHTDMGWPINVGIPTINFGPGNSRAAHNSDEYLEVDELIKATKMIAMTIIDWCGISEE
ncbi:ArgE/DapE family deacylase [Sporolactobacillus kofuensis]|uniref:Probable succinyl-diaminopimelate desuccinylase n=1 Tax=Sporolactobacillus kofuensis TaxID=269672 RepID=A0ABW1WBH1_9BACL|nr:ArgE/DapE family deacylase [Sporolactobacillus kofuensis]MCO7174823.1 ArgE/DapE family deacylase [Sporolactobacillus kofuensis]